MPNNLIYAQSDKQSLGLERLQEQKESHSHGTDFKDLKWKADQWYARWLERTSGTALQPYPRPQDGAHPLPTTRPTPRPRRGRQSAQNTLPHRSIAFQSARPLPIASSIAHPTLPATPLRRMLVTDMGGGWYSSPISLSFALGVTMLHARCLLRNLPLFFRAYQCIFAFKVAIFSCTASFNRLGVFLRFTFLVAWALRLVLLHVGCGNGGLALIAIHFLGLRLNLDLFR